MQLVSSSWLTHSNRTPCLSIIAGHHLNYRRYLREDILGDLAQARKPLTQLFSA